MVLKGRLYGQCYAGKCLNAGSTYCGAGIYVYVREMRSYNIDVSRIMQSLFDYLHCKLFTAPKTPQHTPQRVDLCVIEGSSVLPFVSWPFASAYSMPKAVTLLGQAHVLKHRRMITGLFNRRVVPWT